MSGYIGTQPVPQATQTRQTFVATAAQTSFATGGYQAGYLDVFLNGVKLQDNVDYTATNGSDIVLTVGAALDDTLELVAYTAFEVLDQTFTGTTTVDVLDVTGAFTSTDLTLSGGVYLGGTGAANKLDDYEEGTFTVTAAPETSGSLPLFSTLNLLSYTKVGRLVTVSGMMYFSTPSSPVGTYVTVSGLPFVTPSGTEAEERADASVTYKDASTAAFSVKGGTLGGASSAFLVYMDASTIAGADQFYISFTYLTDA